MIPENAPKLEIDFTDEKLSGRAGLAFIAQQAKRLNWPRLIKQSIHLKQRNRGCGDDQMLLSLIYSFCCGNGSLSDVDALKADTTTMSGPVAKPKYIRELTIPYCHKQCG